jgi:hypothetical protein
MGRQLSVVIDMMDKIMVSVTKEMRQALEIERKKRMLDNLPETVRSILGEYFKGNQGIEQTRK